MTRSSRNFSNSPTEAQEPKVARLPSTSAEPSNFRTSNRSWHHRRRQVDLNVAHTSAFEVSFEGRLDHRGDFLRRTACAALCPDSFRAFARQRSDSSVRLGDGGIQLGYGLAMAIPVCARGGVVAFVGIDRLPAVRARFSDEETRESAHAHASTY